MARVKTDHCVVTWTLVNVVKYCSTFTPSYHISNAQNIPRYYAVEEGKNTNGKRSNKMVALSHPNCLFFLFVFLVHFFKKRAIKRFRFFVTHNNTWTVSFAFSHALQNLYEVQMIFCTKNLRGMLEEERLHILIVWFLVERGVLISQSGWPCLTG